MTPPGIPPTAHRAIDRIVLADILHHAAFAAHLVGHLNDNAHADLITEISDHVDAIVHALTELLGNPHALAVAAPPDDHAPLAGAPVRTSIAGGAP
jgi:hypothetical protein